MLGKGDWIRDVSTNNTRGRSWYLSVLITSVLFRTAISFFRTSQLFSKTFIKLVLLKCPTNFKNKTKSISNKFQNFFKPNHKYPFQNVEPKLGTFVNLYFFNYFCANLQDIKFQVCKIFAKHYKVQNQPMLRGN